MPKQPHSAVAAALSSLPHMSGPLSGAGIAQGSGASTLVDDLAITQIGQKLATLSAEHSRLERIAVEAKDAIQRIYVDDSLSHICDQLHALRWALASLEASSLPAAAIQCAAAFTMLEELAGRDDLHEAEVRRALRRMIASASRVLNGAAWAEGSDEQENNGIGHLFAAHCNPWAGYEARIAAIDS